jgi:RHS repeat-associated protein
VYTSRTDAVPDVSNYVYDATGKVMGIYENTSSTSTDYDLTEMPLYAGSRIGMYKPSSKVDDDIAYTAASDYTRVVGNKRYEISDYLGNVREVVNDIKEPVSGGGYTAKVIVSNDYYAYGMLLLGRNEGESSYRYGFQGKEHDNEVKSNANSYDFGARMYDPRVGRWFSRDPKDSLFPSMSPYNAFNNNPIVFIDPTGEASVTGAQLKEAADARRDVQKGTRALFAITAALKPGDELSGAELMEGLPSDFRSGSPGTYAQLRRVKTVSNNEGVISVETTDGKALVFGSDEGGFIIVENGATFKVSSSSSSLTMSSVEDITLSSDREGSWGSSTALVSAVVKKSGESTLVGKLTTKEVNFGETILGP